MKHKLIAVLAMMGLAACQPAYVQDAAAPMVEREQTATAFEILSVSRFPSGDTVWIIRDRETGCEYVIYDGYKAGNILPRSGQLCGPS